MSRLRLILASLALSTSLSAGCAPTVHATPTSRPAQSQIDRAALRSKLAARRSATFDRFRAYRDARVYPINNRGGMRHLWFDDFGNLCAAATLISGDWGRAITLRVGAADRELRLADVTTGPLLDWMLTSGLTQHELVAIQAPGFAGGGGMFPRNPEDPETLRLYQLYTDVERQMRSLWDRNLDEAVDALIERPALARLVLSNRVAGPGRYATPIPGERDPLAMPVAPPATEPAVEPTPEPAPIAMEPSPAVAS